MFCKGDKIVYPLYGAGIIEELEQKEINGQQETYYVLHIPISNLKIMVSASKAPDLGIRSIYKKDEMIHIIKNSVEMDLKTSDNWNQRYKENYEKIKSGHLDEVALVFRSLMVRERNKSLSSAEKKMLTTAKQIIISELVLAQSIEKSEAEELLLEAVAL